MSRGPWINSRRALIAASVNRQPAESADVAQRFGISVQHAHNDLQALAKQKRVQRVENGARVVWQGVQS